MKITFKKRHLNSNLFYGVFFTVIGLIMLKSNQEPWHAILSIVFSILYVAKYSLQKHDQYLALDKGGYKG
jgi:heme O synthase-like polyprenyltransferase